MEMAPRSACSMSCAVECGIKTCPQRAKTRRWTRYAGEQRSGHRRPTPGSRCRCGERWRAKRSLGNWPTDDRRIQENRERGMSETHTQLRRGERKQSLQAMQAMLAELRATEHMLTSEHPPPEESKRESEAYRSVGIQTDSWVHEQKGMARHHTLPGGVFRTS